MDLTISKLHLGLLVGTPVAFGIGKYLAKMITIPQAQTGEEQQEQLDGMVVAELSDSTMGHGRLVAAIDECGVTMSKEISSHRRGMSVLHQSRAMGHEVLKNWPAVKGDCAKALEFDCRNGMAYLSRARANEATGDLQECLNDLAAARILLHVSRISDGSLEFASIESFLQRILQQSAEADAKAIMRQRGPRLPSKMHINSHMSAFSADPLQAMSFDRCEDLQGFPRAHWAFRDQRFEDVIPACSEEIDSTEHWARHKPEARLLRGTFHLLCGSFAECQQDFEALIGDADADATLRAYALIRSGALRLQLQQQDEALDAFEQAARLAPDNPDLYHQRALIHSKLQDLEAALVDFEMASCLAPGHGSSVALKHFTEYQLAKLQDDQPRMATALRRLDKVGAAFPNTIDGHMLKGSIMSERKDFARALACFEKAARLAPRNPVLMANRAILELKQHDNAELIIPLLYEAIELDPRCATPYAKLATLEMKRHNPDKAVELLNQSCLYSDSLQEVLHACTVRNGIMACTVAKKNLGMGLGLGVDQQRHPAGPEATV
ncbi:mitochondrial import receptor subunit TOM70-like [Drosophila guanche]|uniref:Blast:Mitochondrial import receptor subunit TOM70 n=1 Tax=Drosophila guanche TaxID=7266 RepID=A0A3B0K1E7_DROGU|nr:mitochondrial import receptor subunit TOM70-like [Drosophila guanche]SPP78841.1 blast:Mitochondrial import receptor subunit TOM70 [Drosophila guanche]